MVQEPKTFVRMRAIDILPNRWGVWHRFEGGEPFINDISYRRWSEDGETIWFGLESCSTLNAKPDEEIEVVALPSSSYWTPERLTTSDAEDAERMGTKPTPPTKCPTCGMQRHLS